VRPFFYNGREAPEISLNPDLFQVGVSRWPLVASYLEVTTMTTKPRKWYGQRFVSRPFQDRLEVIQRPATYIRMLKKAPYKVSYADFSYTVQPVALVEENVSYIAARMITANGRLCQPLHEYELSVRFPNQTGADEVWSNGFEAKGDQFVSRALIDRLIDEQAAEVIPAPSKPIFQEEPAL